jgi:hypothetical protein
LLSTAKLAFLSPLRAVILGKKETHGGNDALPDLTLETQIGLAQLGTFLTKLSDLGALSKGGIKTVVNTLSDA